MASPKIQIKRGSTTPLVSDFSVGELALNLSANTLYAQSGALAAATALATSSTFTIGSVTSSITYLGVVGFSATMATTTTNSGVAVGDILRGTNGVGGDLGQFPTTQCIVTAISASPFQTLTFWSSSTPTAGVVTAVTKTSPLKWVGAEIENTLTSTNFNKLTTQAGIATYIGNNSLALGGGTLMGTLNLSNTTNTTPGELRLLEASTNSGSNYTYIKAPASLTGNFGIILPGAAPTANGQVLTSSDTSGTLTWTTPAAVPTITPVANTSTGTALPIVFVDLAGTGLNKNTNLNFIPTTGVLTSTIHTATDGAASTTSSLNGTSLTTGAATFNLINTTATTVNFAGVATALSIGAATGTTTVNNNTVITGNLTTIGNTVHNGNFTVAGTQTYLNTTVMTVTDKNIELGFGTGTSGGAATANFTNALIVFPAHTGTVSRIGTTGFFGKITFSNTTSIPTGVRPGTELNSGISGTTTAGYLGGTPTVTSITPNEIYYTASSNVPVAGTNTGLTVTNDYVANITLTTGTTSNMVVGSIVAGTLSSGTLTTPTVGAINSATVFVLVNRGLLATVNFPSTTISTGAASDVTADGGGFTIKGTTDKTFTWVSATNSNWPTGRFSMNQPLEVVQTCTSTVTANNSCLRLKSDATLDSDGLVGGGHFVDTMIEFNNITTSVGTTTTSTAWFGVDKNNRLKFQTTRNANVFSVDYLGNVEDCTIDCGTF